MIGRTHYTMCLRRFKLVIEAMLLTDFLAKTWLLEHDVAYLSPVTY